MTEAKIWDRFAERYDLIVRLFDRNYTKIIERLPRDIPKGSKVLEIAAGTGQFTVAIARLAQHLTATDISPEMVERLQRRIRNSNVENVVCETVSGYELPFRDGSIDVVFCANALHVMTDPTKALSEFHRVLNSDGVLIAPTFLHGVDRVRRAISKTMGLVSPFVAHTRFDLQELEALITNAVFNVLVTDQYSGVFPIGYIVARRSDYLPPTPH